MRMFYDIVLILSVLKLAIVIIGVNGNAFVSIVKNVVKVVMRLINFQAIFWFAITLILLVLFDDYIVHHIQTLK